MKATVSIILILFFAGFLTGSGCTKVDTPVRDNEGSEEESGQSSFIIISAKDEILDTEPVLLEAEGGSGTVYWEVEPYHEGRFVPETGTRVIFSPPDISFTTTFTIKATDDTEAGAQISIVVVDEGPSPSPGDILINEIAWAGTLTSAYDEYIELINKTERDIYMDFWLIENAAGSGKALYFSGRINAGKVFLIANYNSDSEKTALAVVPDVVDAAVSISNSASGPFILKNKNGEVIDSQGDGEAYIYGKNEQDSRASMSRYTWCSNYEWSPQSWYTESISVNLKDSTSGTPGFTNSDTPFSESISEDDALAIITEYYIDFNQREISDWVELLITRSGNIKNFMVTDLDGDDTSITGGKDIYVEEGKYIVLVWKSEYHYQENDYFFIPDSSPTGTKDELALFCKSIVLDCLAYTSDGKNPDDFEKLCQEYGWEGEPIFGKYASRKRDSDGEYVKALSASSWIPEAEPIIQREN